MARSLQKGRTEKCAIGKDAGAAERRRNLSQSRALRVATKFGNIAKRYYAAQGRDIDIIQLNGSIELAPIPVSYTHLDVYKRQLPWCGQLHPGVCGGGPARPQAPEGRLDPPRVTDTQGGGSIPAALLFCCGSPWRIVCNRFIW